MAKRTLRLKTRFYVIFAILLIVITLILVLALGSDTTGTLREGSMTYEMDVTAAIIRNEVSVGLDQRYDRISFVAREGEQIYENMPVARVFKWGYSDDMLQSLLTVEAEIYNEQMTQVSGVENADLDSINLRITQKRAEIAACVQDPDSADLLELEMGLKSLLAERKVYLKEKVQPTEQLNSLYQSEDTKKTLVDSYMSEVPAVGSGIVSFYFDGFEQVLTADKLSMVNADLINNAIKSSDGFRGGSSNNLVCRIVVPNNWYIAFVSSKSGYSRIADGLTYTVVFDGYATTPFSGKSLGNEVHENGVLNIIEFSDDIGPLLSTRKVNVKLSVGAEGLEIPLSCVAIKDNVPIVRISGSTGEYDVEVDIMAQDEDVAIIRAKNETDVLSAGLRYVKP